MPPSNRKENRASEPSYDIRASGDGSGFAGYASTWWAVDSYLTAMAPGAFSETIKNRADHVKVLYNHNLDDNIGVPEVLREDERGLYVEATIIDDGAEGTTFMRRLKGGARFGLSFGFRELRGRPATETDPINLSQWPGRGWADVWVIEEVKLYEFSPVTFPSNETADITEIRKSGHVLALQSLYDDIRSGTLDDDEMRAVSQVVAELESAAPQHADAARTETSARQFIDLDLAMARYRYLLDRESA